MNIKTKLYHALAIAILLSVFLGIFLVVNLPKLWAFDWDLKCLIVECRIIK